MTNTVTYGKIGVMAGAAFLTVFGALRSHDAHEDAYQDAKADLAALEGKAQTSASMPLYEARERVKRTRENLVHYRYCADVRAAGKAPLYRGEPGYAEHLDRDGDGIACEPYR